MRKIIVEMLICGAVFCGQMQAMEGWGQNEHQLYEQAMQAVNEDHPEEDEYVTAPGTRSSSPLLTNNESDSVDQLIDGVIYALTKAGPVLNGMHESDALNVQSITKFYDVSTSTWRYRGLYGAELLVGTAHNPKSSLASAAQLVCSLAKNVPRVGRVLERLEQPNTDNNNNNNRDASSYASAASSVTPVSDAAFMLRHFNVNKVVIDTMKNHEPAVNDFLKFMHKTISEHGNTAISFLKEHKETISNTLRTTAEYAKDNKQEIIDGMYEVRDAYNQHEEMVTAYLAEHSEDIKNYAGMAKKYSPVFMAGVRAAYAQYAVISAADMAKAVRDDPNNTGMTWWCG